jgi:hypothetical protein
LEEKEGTAFLLCNSIIDSQEYYHNADEERTKNGATVYANNYAESNIRKWLNETFYETAFTSLQQGLIQITELDNSAKSTNPSGQPTYWSNGANDCVCANTNDKIFLLSGEEVTNSNYGFNSNPYNESTTSARIRKPSDYAQSQGCWKRTDTDPSYFGKGQWWLRSPSNNSQKNLERVVSYSGSMGEMNVGATSNGVVPALKITL